MLLIPFIENSFKHGLMSVHEKAFVHIHLGISGGKLQFRVQNSHGETDTLELVHQKGIGIDNTRQRLGLLYPGQYELDIGTLEDVFTVNLSIELKQ